MASRWSPGRRSGLRHWPRAPRKRRPPVTGIPPWVRGGPIARSAKGRHSAPLWRLPALHPLIRGERKTGKTPPRLKQQGRRSVGHFSFLLDRLGRLACIISIERFRCRTCGALPRPLRARAGVRGPLRKMRFLLSPKARKRILRRGPLTRRAKMRGDLSHRGRGEQARGISQ